MARVRAPELSGAGGWIGSSSPLSLAALSGKIVLLHFWTSCCINCVRVLDELRPIEERFADEVVVIGVHSPKFAHEHEHETVERAVKRLRVAHPVLDDPNLTTWQEYGVRGWPTVVVIDPDGYVVGGISGEGCGPVLTQTIQGLIQTHDDAGTLTREPIPTISVTSGPSSLASSQRTLDHPGKVAVDASGGRLAIADTGHDRVLICDRRGRIEAAYDNLHQPQGVRFDGDRLIVCDTGLDRVVAIDLEGGTQTVLATGIASPWDAVIDGDGSVVIAEAGRHRLWRIATTDGDSSDGAASDGAWSAGATVIAGTGEENLVDGPALDALLAQPSGLTRVPGALLVVDAESSALRALIEGSLRTLVGQGLFEWGASDGGPESAAMQHPLGVVADATGATVYVADTFNSMLRAWSGTAMTAEAGTLRTLPVAGLDEPGGLDLLPDGRLVVCDTNHHRVVVVDPMTGAVEPLVLDESWIGTVGAEPVRAVPGTHFEVPYDVQVGAFALDSSVAQPVRVEVSAFPATLLGPGPRVWASTDEHGVVELPAGQSGAGTLLIEVAASVCDDLQCTVLHFRTRRELTITADGEGS